MAVAEIRVVGLASAAEHLAGLANHHLVVDSRRIAEADPARSGRRYSLVSKDRDAAGAGDVLQVAAVAGTQRRLVLLPHPVGTPALVDPDIAAAGRVVHQPAVG